MDFERIITLILIMIIWVVSNAIRKKANPAPKDQAPGEKPSGFFEIIQQNLAPLEERSRGGETIDMDEYLQPKSQTDEHGQESLIEMAEDAMQQRETVPTPAPPEVIKPQATILPKKPGATVTNRRKLQNTIIWAEILAPPVALRDQ